MDIKKQEFLSLCNFKKGGGLIPVVTQDASTKEVLMVAYVNQEALIHTLDTGQMHYQSRERGLWHKGSTSGNFQNVVSLQLDCDNDTILAMVIPEGPACHTGSITCFVDSPSISIDKGES